MTAKEIFLELLKEDGRPERQLVQYEALQMALGDPIGGYLHMGRRPGATITDLWGTVIEWPEDHPGSMPHVTEENKVIKDITRWRDYVHAPDIIANLLRARANPVESGMASRDKNIVYPDHVRYGVVVLDEVCRVHAMREKEVHYLDIRITDSSILARNAVITPVKMLCMVIRFVVQIPD